MVLNNKGRKDQIPYIFIDEYGLKKIPKSNINHHSQSLCYSICNGNISWKIWVSLVSEKSPILGRLLLDGKIVIRELPGFFTTETWSTLRDSLNLDSPSRLGLNMGRKQNEI